MTEAAVQGPARAAREQRLRELRDAPAYRNYELARERVLDMKDRTAEVAGVAMPSSYWRDELDYLDFMLDASPIVISKLRHHCFYLTGIRPYDYRQPTTEGKSDRPRFFAAKLDMLAELGSRDLLVPESPILGGFGYEIDGSLYNVDTIKFFEVMLGMERAGVLDTLRGAESPVVCEIGSGWGGFAYTFKTLFPDATVVLVDFPELFLFSATYLMTAFPDARVEFWRGPESAARVTGEDRVDFLFVPHNQVDSHALPQLDLVVNMVSFQEMRTDQVRNYVRWASRSGSAHLYSLNRDRSPYNTELTNVRDVIAEEYDYEELVLLPMAYSKIVDPRKLTPKKAKARTPLRAAPEPAPDHMDYRHVVGRLRR